MDSLVPTEISTELAQILSNILQGDNELRRQSERLLNERYLAANPSAVLLALLQFSRSGPEHMRSFSLVLLRRLLFRSLPPTMGKTLYDHLSETTRNTIEEVSIRSMAEETSEPVRRKFADTICDLANGSMERGRPFSHLPPLLQLTLSLTAGHREVAFRIFGSVPNLVLDEDIPQMLTVFERGLKDPEAITVRQAALRASVFYLCGIDYHRRLPNAQTQLAALMPAMLDTLLPLSQVTNSNPDGELPLTQPTSSPTTLSAEHTASFIRLLIPLATNAPWFFAPHLADLLKFLPPLILPRVGGTGGGVRSKTPTQGTLNPNQTTPTKAEATLPLEEETTGHHEERDEEEDELRVAALELMVSLSEARPSMVKRQDGWVAAMVRGSLEGMGEVTDASWSQNGEPADDDHTQYVEAFEQALDRLAVALGGTTLLPIAFHFIPQMLHSPDWRHRYAGLIAIAAVAEGSANVMAQELGKVVALVTPTFQDPHPRVQWAACQCMYETPPTVRGHIDNQVIYSGTLCDDLNEVIQDQFYSDIIGALLIALGASEPRVHAHAAAALINFCESVPPEVLTPHLDVIVQRLLAMLNEGSKRYVQEQALTSLAMVADAASTAFQQYYSTIMPLLLNVLRNATAFDHRKLRCKAMECAGLIAIAVGETAFKSDAQELTEIMMRIQSTPSEVDDTVESYLVATWAKICQALGPSFEPYLPFIMPSLLRAAAIKADLTILGEAGEDDNDFEGWDTVDMDGQKVGIRTAVLEQKANAYAMLVTHVSVMGSKFQPWLGETMALVIPGLRFFFHDGVREACTLLIPMLLACAKQTGTLSPETSESVLTQLVLCLKSQTDPGYLASLFKSLTDSLVTIGGALPPDILSGALTATQTQLQIIAQKRTVRSQRLDGSASGAPSGGTEEEDREEALLLEEMENFELEEMRKFLKMIDSNHPLLVAIGSITELGIGKWDEEDG